jgi:hypothetical protein
MQSEENSINQHQNLKGNRPHCLYLWFIHGNAVCSEEHLNRSCAYPFWDCPVKSSIADVHDGIVNESSSSGISQEKIYKELGSA